MTIYSSTTLVELLDELDLRTPDLAAPIRERVTELEDDLADERTECSKMAARVEALETRIEGLEGES